MNINYQCKANKILLIIWSFKEKMKKINKMIYWINNKQKYKDQKEWYLNYNQKILSKRIFINYMIIQKFN